MCVSAAYRMATNMVNSLGTLTQTLHYRHELHLPPPPPPVPMPPYTILITSFIYNHVGQERGSGCRKCGIIEQTSERYSTILDPLVLARFCKVFQGLLSTMVFFPVSPHSHGYQLHVHVLVVSCKQFKMHRLEKLLPT